MAPYMFLEKLTHLANWDGVGCWRSMPTCSWGWSGLLLQQATLLLTGNGVGEPGGNAGFRSINLVVLDAKGYPLPSATSFGSHILQIKIYLRAEHVGQGMPSQHAAWFDPHCLPSGIWGDVKRAVASMRGTTVLRLHSTVLRKKNLCQNALGFSQEV